MIPIELVILCGDNFVQIYANLWFFQKKASLAKIQPVVMAMNLMFNLRTIKNEYFKQKITPFHKQWFSTVNDFT